MTILLDRCRRKRGAIRPISEEQKRILPDVTDRVETGYVQWQSDCSFCNRYKGPNIAGIDPVSKKLSPLFHPRRHKWSRHFRYDGPILVGLTRIGKATIAVLHINDPEAVALREALIETGVWR
jgi:hypothetical protein